MLIFKAKTERKDKSKSTPITGPEERMNKRPRGIKDHHPHVNNKFLTVQGVNFKHTGLTVVATGQIRTDAKVLFFETSETDVEMSPHELLEKYSPGNMPCF